MAGTPGAARQTPSALAAEQGGFEYVADSYADDLPYWYRHDGRAQLIVPYTLDANDMRFVTAQGFNAGDQFYTYLKDSFDVLYEEGAARRRQNAEHRAALQAGGADRVGVRRSSASLTMPRPMTACGLLGASISPGTGARPFRPGQRPGWSAKCRKPTLSRGSAVSSSTHRGLPNAAWHLEAGPAHDTAAGIHSLLCRAFRCASEDERLGVLQAHPDLAGRLAAAKRLTAESAKEQASAGLDALSDAERQRFTELNTRYVERFGFPFILAVKGLSKEAILANFEARIDNSRASEFATACGQVERIAQLRLDDIFGAED